jgi:hypothetical protein
MSSSSHHPTPQRSPLEVGEPPAFSLAFTSSTGSRVDEMALPSQLACHLALAELSAPTITVPPDDIVELVAFHARIDDEGGHEMVRRAGRLIAARLFLQDDEPAHEAGRKLLKALARAGDALAKLQHAELLTRTGPHRNHHHANILLLELLNTVTPFDCLEGYARLHHLYGMLVWKGDKVLRSGKKALDHFEWAASRYRDGESAWLAAQFYSPGRHPDFSDVVKPDEELAARYLALSQELGYDPATFHDQPGV